MSARAPRHQASPAHAPRMLPNAEAPRRRAGRGSPVMLLPAVETLRASRHSVRFGLSADKVDRSRRVLLRKPLPGAAGDGCPGSRARPLTLGCARYHGGACGANLSQDHATAKPASSGRTRHGRVGASFGPTLADSAGRPGGAPRRRADGLQRAGSLWCARCRLGLWLSLGACSGARGITRRPRTIGRLCCPIARKGVRYGTAAGEAAGATFVPDGLTLPPLINWRPRLSPVVFSTSNEDPDL
jgi:hypothetical protein